MSERVLSQDEVDLLMKGMGAGEVDTDPKEAHPEGIQAYDLTAQERILRGRMPTFDMIHDRFCRLQSAAWSGLLRLPVEFSTVKVDIIKFAAFLKRVPVPSSLNVFTLKPLRGHGLVVMDAPLVYSLVDYFFGGTRQTHVKPEGRDFTMLQQRIISTMVSRALGDLEKAWLAVLPAKVQHVRSESNPQFAMVVSTPEIVVTTLFRVDLGDSAHEVTVMYPYAMLEPIKEKLYAGFFADQMEGDLGWTGRFKEGVLNSAVHVAVLLGTATVRVKEVLQLGVGDVLVLDQRPGDSATGMVEGLPKFMGTMGVVKGTNAFKIAKVMSESAG